VQLARKNHPVKLYSSPDCGTACDSARALLNTRGVPFTEISVSTDDALAELERVSAGSLVPVLLVGRDVRKGFEEGAYHQSLDDAGYPKAGVLPRRNQSAPKAARRAAAEDTQGAAEAAPAYGPYSPHWR
jgi:hypothetical protein